MLRVIFVTCLINLAGLAWGQCPAPNGYFPDARQCDKYIECHDGIATEQLCGDGLLFNEKAAPFRFACDYPVDVDCGSRTLTQQAQPTGNCPRQWGMFPVGDRTQCGQFLSCVGGREYVFNCPEGLAFSTQSLRCEWPDEVENCDAEAFLGFRCPAAASQGELLPAGNPLYAHPSDCRRFFTCVNGVRPRLNVCPEGLVFNAESSVCDDPALVRGCENYYPPSLKNIPNAL